MLRIQQAYRFKTAAYPIFERYYTSAAPAMTRISDAIKRDHRELETAYQHILSSKDATDKRKWQNQFTWELARLSIAEELLVYPAFEKHLQDGRILSGKDRSEHQVVKEKLYRFQGLNPTDTEFETALKSLWSDLAQHIKEEEEHDLLQLEKALPEPDSHALTIKFNRTKRFIPSRSHPSAPDKPPFETVASMMAAPIDRMADIFRSFPEETKREMPR